MKENIKYYDGVSLYNMFANGILNLVKHQVTLDEINVYPVPDGDTGTNMAFTLLPIAEECKEDITENASETLKLIADTALDSARGNSGTIIAQFLYGMSKSADNLGSLGVKDFSNALNQGFHSARNSLVKPEEGTIITVMRDVAEESQTIISEGVDDYYSLIKNIYKRAEISLKETKNILKILKKTDVVDAGALGFVLLIQGMLNVIEKAEGGRIQTTHLDISYEISKIEQLSKDVDFTIKNKYCTECVVIGQKIDRTELKDKIKDFGDSMVMAGTDKKVKIHIHTNHPGKLFKICNVYGNVIDKKVDDMTRQEQSIHHEGASSIAIVTDSGADIPEEFLKDVHVVPVKYSFGRQQHIDRVTQTTREFYEQMAVDSNHPKTSQPVPRDFKKTYNFISSHYSSILSIHLSSAVSGTYQSALNASKSLKHMQLNVFDSKTASVGLGLLVMHAIELKQEGKTFNEIVYRLNQKMLKTKIFLVIDDLNYIVRGGRLPSKVKTISNIFRLRPVLTVKKSGKMTLGGILYGKSNMMKKFSHFINKKINSKNKYNMIVAHANCKSKGENLLNNILSEHGHNINNSYLVELSGGLGSHAGPGALVVGFQKQN
ncbi:MAG: hypothetical protein CMG64_01045 [Candidatus Marinimicrobia bacterium]|nr:hypothetical protein [Candidatus Neomarinimicrobiota bacterium]|tara:strand:- start:4065 stop:5876 length:1812 start_codon:yes stop_codon:yes gene_type:complete